MNSDDDLTPEAAAAEVGRAAWQVRRRARWPGWMFPVFAAIAIAGIVTAVAGLVIYQTVMPQHFTGWLLLLAALMVSPYFVGAWRWLHL